MAARYSREAWRYAWRLRNPAKQEYCGRVLREWERSGDINGIEWSDLGLSYMGAQAVRIALAQYGVK